MHNNMSYNLLTHIHPRSPTVIRFNFSVRNSRQMHIIPTEKYN
nr:MAG TPA: hypothetical protein [Caudoviricetes sp.]